LARQVNNASVHSSKLAFPKRQHVKLALSPLMNLPPILKLCKVAMGSLILCNLCSVAALAFDNPELKKPTTSVASPVLAAKPTKPEWKELSPAEQLALKPLQANWQTMGTGQKRKWQEVSKNFNQLPSAEKSKLHSRMTDWALLSPQQRAQARINFAENLAITDGLTAEQRAVQWQAYQQLSPEQKSKLASTAAQPAIRVAAAAKPAEPLKNAPPPKHGTASALAKTANTTSAKIAVAPQTQKSGSLVPSNPDATSVQASQ
jgi:hypothetical protein